MNSITASMENTVSFHQTVYKIRWFILFILAWLNLVNGIIWISYASISDKVSSFYDITLDQVNYLSLVFPVMTIVLSLPVVWGMDRVGLRWTCIACGWLNLVSAALRLVGSHYDVAVTYRYPLAFSGQIVGAIAQPLAMFSPAKLASMWFASHERAIATTIGAMGNPLGVLMGSVLPPLLVQCGLFNISVGIVIMSLVSALLPTLGLWRSAPPVPPSISADRHFQQLNFFDQIKACCSRFSFIVLSLAFGVGLGIFTALSTLFQQIFCPFGYDDKFAGACGGILIGAGLIGSVISGLVADRTKAFTEIIQACLASSTLGIIAFSVLASFSNMDVPIGLAVAWIGAFGVAIYSISLELAAEITFPVSENISTGLLVVAGQIFSVVFLVLSPYLKLPMAQGGGTIDKRCLTGGGSPGVDYWAFNVFISCVALAGCCFMLFGFSAKYRRQLMDKSGLSTQEESISKANNINMLSLFLCYHVVMAIVTLILSTLFRLQSVTRLMFASIGGAILAPRAPLSSSPISCPSNFHSIIASKWVWPLTFTVTLLPWKLI